MVPSGSPLFQIAATLGTAKLQFIVDTGASVSIIPSSYINGIILEPTPVSISTASGEKIKCHGQAHLEISIPSLRRSFKWIFIIADIMQPLLGLDFLTNYGLIIDCKGRKIYDSITQYSVPVSPASVTFNVIVNMVSESPEIQPLLEKYPNITSPHKSEDKPYKGIYHRINTGSNPPVFARPRQLAEKKLAIAKCEFQKLLDNGTISISDSEWSTPLHMVPKSDDKYRVCGDFRALNSITIADRYPIPNINSFTQNLANKTRFSKIDLVSAFHQIKVHPDDVHKTAVTTPFGLYHFNNMPFGLKNASATFQRQMDKLFSQVKNVYVYMDDLCIASEDEETHMKDLDTVLGILSEYDFKISLEKCEFNRSEINFLGHRVTPDGIQPTVSKIGELEQYPAPNDSKSLRRFLGMVGFYRKLIPHFSTIVYPLTELIRLNPKAKSLTLSEGELEAFNDIKTKLSNVSALPHPQPTATNFQLVTDSSQYAVGAALHQMIDGKPVPIGFFSKKLSQPQTTYSAFDRELLAAYLATLHFKHRIEGRYVILLTDHKPLCSAFHSLKPAKSDRQQRHLSILTEYLSDATFIKGSQNIVADCLSRPANAVLLDACDLPELAEKQINDEEITEYHDRLRECKLNNDGKSILCDVSLPYPRPFVVKSLRKSIYDSIHLLTHPGIKATTKMIKSRYFWPDMDRNIRNWCRECMSCQQSKIHRHTHSPIEEYDNISPRLQTVHIDIVGPLNPVRNDTDPYNTPYRYLLTCIDRCTRWIEAEPLIDITAETIAHAFFRIWVSRLGVPLHVVTDRGAQFEAELFNELSKIVGFHRLRTVSYNPKCNGKIERIHRTIKTALIARKENWFTSLPVVLFGIRSIPNDSGVSPFSALTGSQMLMPKLLLEENNDVNEHEFNHKCIRELRKEMLHFDISRMSESRPYSKIKSYIPKDLKTCDKVWLRVDRVKRPLEAPYTGPYRVIKRNPKFYCIEISENVHNNVSIDRLKPVILPSSTENNEAIEPHESNEEMNNNENVDEDSNETADAASNEPATADLSSDEPPDTATVTTRSGRRVRWRKDNSFIYF